VFLDGVGIGPSDPDINPFLRAELPVLRSMLGGEIPTLESTTLSGVRGMAFPVDATLGVEGLPQSGTGQIAILTGENAPLVLGRHFGPWPPVRLRELLESRNLFRRALAQGNRVAFANAYPKGWPGTLPWRRLAAPPLAAHSAGVLTREIEALVAEDAVASEITNDGWRRYTGREDLPEPSPHRAGQTLARIASGADLTLFAHWATDHEGHRGGMRGAIAALERVDAFLGGMMAGAPDTGLELLIVSDHGNVEDVRGGHTRNPALGMVARLGPVPGDSTTARAPAPVREGGPLRSHTLPFTALTGIAPYVLARLEARRAASGHVADANMASPLD